MTSNQKKALKAEHTNRLKNAFVKALQQEQVRMLTSQHSVVWVWLFLTVWESFPCYPHRLWDLAALSLFLLFYVSYFYLPLVSD